MDISNRGESRTAVTSEMERFVIMFNGWKPLTIITKRSILDVAAVLDPPLAYRKMVYLIVSLLLEKKYIAFYKSLVISARTGQTH